MVGVPGEAVSNTLPPDVLLFALGAAQTVLVLALEGPMRRLLDGQRAWAASVLVNGTIMTFYLWHLTVLALPVGRFERSPPLPVGFRPSTPRVLAGAALVSAGIAFLALDGLAAEGGVGVRGVVVAGTILGAWLLGAIGTRWSSA